MTARVVRMTTTTTFFPTKQMASKQRAGTSEATRTDILRAVVVLIRPWKKICDLCQNALEFTYLSSSGVKRLAVHNREYPVGKEWYGRHDGVDGHVHAKTRAGKQW